MNYEIEMHENTPQIRTNDCLELSAISEDIESAHEIHGQKIKLRFRLLSTGKKYGAIVTIPNDIHISDELIEALQQRLLRIPSDRLGPIREMQTYPQLDLQVSIRLQETSKLALDTSS